MGLGSLPACTFLQALNAASQAAKKRGLFLIDAINEGVGGSFWRKELAEFLLLLSKFPNIAVVISCRSEYLTHAVPEDILKEVHCFTVKGFETYSEQSRAARTYLTRQGISQPSNPWLAAEFVNPLFLRSTSLALKKENLTQFPKGVKGTKKVFQFYLRSVAKHLGVGRDGRDELIAPTISALIGIARKMASDRRDFVSRLDAVQILSKEFAAFALSASETWFDVLHRNGLLRLDPDPEVSPDDDFCPNADIVRFSFQRLQDYLMAEALLAEVKDINEALVDGVLSFVYEGRKINRAWGGLIEALSILVPERFGMEFIDALPGTPDEWRPRGLLNKTFAESLRWRDKGAFSERTRELFNDLLRQDDEKFELVIELATASGHPWNAQELHQRLAAQSLSQRDAHWSSHIISINSRLTTVEHWKNLQNGASWSRQPTRMQKFNNCAASS